MYHLVRSLPGRPIQMYQSVIQTCTNISVRLYKCMSDRHVQMCQSDFYKCMSDRSVQMYQSELYICMSDRPVQICQSVRPVQMCEIDRSVQMYVR